METSGPLLSADQIAELYGLDPSQVRTWTDQGLLTRRRGPGGEMGVSVEELRQFLRARGILTAGESPTQFKVLVVDDDPEVRRSLTRSLAKSWPQAWVDEASTGIQGGRKMFQLAPDVVILDIKLPSLDAFDLLSVIRGEPRLAKTVVVAITGYATEENRRKVLAAGAHAFMAKPFDPMELIALIGDLLAERREK
jgi:CheY-like chemotaxis protein